MYGYPPSNEIERRQRAVERMYEREDAELRERIAAERFDEHEGSDMQITVKRLDSGYYHIRGNGPCNWCQVPRWPASRQEIKDGMFPEAGADFVRDVIREAERVIEEAELLKGSDDESQDNRDEDRV